MLEVAVIFCLLGTPGHQCREVVFDPGESATPFQCFANTQIQAARWIEEHPRPAGQSWRVEKWTCRRAGQEAKL